MKMTLAKNAKLAKGRNEELHYPTLGVLSELGAISIPGKEDSRKGAMLAEVGKNN